MSQEISIGPNEEQGSAPSVSASPDTRIADESMTPEKVMADYYQFKLSKCHSSRSSATRISDIGFPCVAYLAFTRIAGEQRDLPDKTLACIFAEGHTQERAVVMDLEAMGYDITESQRSLHWEKFEISGHPDAKISRNGSKPIPMEIKSCSPFAFAKINSELDMRNHKSWIYQKWSAQFQLYLLLEGYEEGWFVIKSKTTGEIKIIPIRLDLEYAEQFLKKAEEVKAGVSLYNQAQQGVTYPQGWPWRDNWLKDHRLNDAAICSECPFKATCLPEIDSGPGAFLMGGEMEEILNERAKVQEASKQFEELDTEIKDAAKRVFDGGHTEIVCGNWHLQGVEQERKGKKFWKVEISKINK